MAVFLDNNATAGVHYRLTTDPNLCVTTTSRLSVAIRCKFPNGGADPPFIANTQNDRFFEVGRVINGGSNSQPGVMLAQGNAGTRQLRLFVVPSAGAGPSTIGNSSVEYPLGVWFTVGVISRSDGINQHRAFLNGVQVIAEGVTNPTRLTADVVLSIGGRGNAAADGFRGIFAEFVVWNGILDASDFLAFTRGVNPFLIGRNQPSGQVRILAYHPIYRQNSQRDLFARVVSVGSSIPAVYATPTPILYGNALQPHPPGIQGRGDADEFVASMAVRGVAKDFSESRALADTLSPTMSFSESRALTDTLLPSPSVYFRSLSETRAISDTLDRSINRMRTILEARSMADSLVVAKFFAETRTLADTLDRSVNFLRAIEETRAITDKLMPGALMSESRTLADTLKVLNLFINETRSLISDDHTFLLNQDTLLQESRALVDQLVKSLATTRFLGEMRSLTDSMIASPILPDSRSLTDMLEFDLVHPGFAETFQLSDIMMVSTAMFRSISETRNLIDEIMVGIPVPPPPQPVVKEVPPLTTLSVWNMALTKVGQPIVKDVNENTKSANLIRGVWDLTRQSFLCDFKWNKATQSIKLLQEDVVPVGPFTKQYMIPSSVLKVWTINELPEGKSNELWSVELAPSGDRGALYTDEALVTAEVTVDLVEVGVLSPQTQKALAAVLAAEIAPNAGRNISETDRLRAAAIQEVAEAKRSDSQESGPVFRTDTTLLDARRAFGTGMGF